MSRTSTEGDPVEVETELMSSAGRIGDAAEQSETAQGAEPVESSSPELGYGAEDDEVVAAQEAEGSDPDEPGSDDGPNLDLDEPAPSDELEVEDAASEGTDEPFMVDELETTSDEEDLDLVATPPEMSQMLFVDVVLLLPATHPVVVLQEADAPFRELRIPVGGAEGIAIGYAARQVATPRPLTHELFARVLEDFGMTLDVVRITDVHGAAFSAEMVVSGPLGTRVIDCRPSDAIALTLRQRLPAPIMASPMVLAIAGTDPLGAN